MKKSIIIGKEDREFIMRAFGCSRQAVWNALNYNRDSHLSKRIRVLALKRGGVVTGGYSPVCRATIEDGVMTQDFGGGVVLIVRIGSADVDVVVDGEKAETRRAEGIDGLAAIQKELERMAMERMA